MFIVRSSALTGFRSGWSHLKAAVPSTDSDLEPAQVNRLDYAADGSEDDGKEASSNSTGIRKPTKANESSTKVRADFYSN